MLGQKPTRRTSSVKKRPAEPTLPKDNTENEPPVGASLKRTISETDSQPNHHNNNGADAQDAKRQKVAPPKAASPQIAKTIRQQYGDLLAYPELLYHPRVIELCQQVYYSPRYYDDDFEYRHVILPKQMLEYIPSKLKGRLLKDEEWRSIGILQSPGWEHYMLHAPEPHVYMFRREKNYQEKYTASEAASTQPTAPEQQEEEEPFDDADEDNESDNNEQQSPNYDDETEGEEEVAPSPEDAPPVQKGRRGRPSKASSQTKKEAASTSTTSSRRTTRSSMGEEEPVGRITRSSIGSAGGRGGLRERKSNGAGGDGAGVVRKNSKRK
ncbi:hypothetical protein HDV00_004359 [Rhizophlyctis rosea]|nr:hypothetical protein HDV00_004359 [Rhizophlyctis rosea]